jgi:hypothetical protein
MASDGVYSVTLDEAIAAMRLTAGRRYRAQHFHTLNADWLNSGHVSKIQRNFSFGMYYYINRWLDADSPIICSGSRRKYMSYCFETNLKIY